MGSSRPGNVLSDSKSPKQRTVFITYENAVVNEDVGACSMMFKLHANHILSCQFHANNRCYIIYYCFFFIHVGPGVA